MRTTLNIDVAALAGAMKTARGKTKTAVRRAAPAGPAPPRFQGARPLGRQPR